MKYLTIILLLLLTTPAFAAKLDLDIPDSMITRIGNAFGGTYSYGSNKLVTGESCSPNPKFRLNEIEPENICVPIYETKKQFLERMLLKHIKEVTISYEARTAGDTARKSAESLAKSEVNI